MFKQTLFIALVVCAFMASSALGQTDGTYFNLRPSGVVCITTPCPSWTVTRANDNTENTTVHSVSFAASINESILFEVEYDQTLVYGYLTMRYVGTQLVRQLIVEQAYRLLPLRAEDQAARAGSFYSASFDNLWRATLLNSDALLTLDALHEPYSSYSHLDMEWLFNKVVTTAAPTKAIVQGTIQHGVLVATAFYINIVDPSQRCPPSPLIGCATGYTAVYSRDVNRCRQMTGCVRPGPCILSIAVCDEGYDLISIPSAPRGCPKFTCDPSFVKKL
ncbi:hypothetical protein SAMD00019534_053820 [Acytostelium subglobosum LB1]|uniref:hypothetical protein n=1 Tax=Acytostelium subglobosum LB1 TaxID=1410327 RepID=UPI000644848C|nr:hypothetical protein SAMD00019534_053820 [Acytostelium subglobosum LB1]GAM22207.1 hypothetical protein SAMD00019534_053820 [Acytostelium subglobosum LB1]|eukprot:XP_012755307.1 hypothetical protein SAMD00019534_053820 [Acytostelium subglobosum LB1]